MCQRRDDMELGQGASGCDCRAPQSREVVAVGVGDDLDFAKDVDYVLHISACRPVIFATLSLLRWLSGQHVLCWRSRLLHPALTHPDPRRGYSIDSK